MNGDPPQGTPAATAGFARRIGSLVYEALLLTAVLFICTWLFLFFVQTLADSVVRPLLQIWLLGVTGVYLVYCWTHGGQTLPMKTWHIRLVMRNGAGVPLRFAIYRYLLALISFAAGGLGFAWALVDRDRQFMHDRLAGTRLIYTRIDASRADTTPSTH